MFGSSSESDSDSESEDEDERKEKMLIELQAGNCATEEERALLKACGGRGAGGGQGGSGGAGVRLGKLQRIKEQEGKASELMEQWKRRAEEQKAEHASDARALAGDREIKARAKQKVLDPPRDPLVDPCPGRDRSTHYGISL